MGVRFGYIGRVYDFFSLVTSDMYSNTPSDLDVDACSCSFRMLLFVAVSGEGLDTVSSVVGVDGAWVADGVGLWGYRRRETVLAADPTGFEDEEPILLLCIGIGKRLFMFWTTTRYFYSWNFMQMRRSHGTR